MLGSIPHSLWVEWAWFLEYNGVPEQNADGRAMDALIIKANSNLDKKNRSKRQELVYFNKERFVGDGIPVEDRLSQAKAQMQALAKKQK